MSMLKCDYCGKPAVRLAGETNGVLVCADHAPCEDCEQGVMCDEHRTSALPLHRTEGSES